MKRRQEKEIVRGPPSTWHSAGVELIRYSYADARAKRHNIEEAQLKSDRAGLYVNRLVKLVQEMRPLAIAYEDYTVYDAEGVGDLVEASKSILSLFGVTRSERVFSTVDELRRALLEDKTLTELLKRLEKLAKGHAKATMNNVYKDAGRGDAANTLIIQGIVNTIPRLLGIPVYAFAPASVAARWRNGQRGTRGKEATAAGVMSVVEGVKNDIDRLNLENGWSHLYDGMGLAVMAAETVRQHTAQRDPFLTLGFDLGWLNLGVGAVICTPR